MKNNDIENNDIENNDNNIILYQDENNITRVSVRFSDEDLWLTQAQIAELYDTTQQNISQHIESIFRDGELQRTATNKKFLLVRMEGTRQVKRNFYQQITDIYATAVDYDPSSDMTKSFFATVQNKLYFAVHENTAAEVIYNRVDNEKPFVGMTNFKGDYVTKDDVKITKNYLSEIELQRRKGSVSHKQAIEKAEKEFELYRQREMKQFESDFDKAMKALKNEKRSDLK